MVTTRVNRDSWWPVYWIHDCKWQGDPEITITEEECVAIKAAFAEFDKWQAFLGKRHAAAIAAARAEVSAE